MTNTFHDLTALDNLRRLFLLRNVIIGGQLIAIYVAYQLKITLYWLPISFVLLLLVFINSLTWWRLHHTTQVGETELTVQLLFDITLLTVLFYFTGGATNPFVSFFLIPLTVAATLFSKSRVWLITMAALFAYSFLIVKYQPVHIGISSTAHGFGIHVLGMWLGFIISAGVIAYFVVSMARSLRMRDQKLALAREKALRDERLVALGTLAAGAAHELGTPLGTMAVLLKEMLDENDNKELEDNIGILISQVKRCKHALSVITVSAGEVFVESGRSLPVNQYVNDIIRHWQTIKPDTQLKLQFQGQTMTELMIAEQTLTQALINIMNNAAEASPDEISITVIWEKQQIRWQICDRGPGLDKEKTSIIGKRLFSTKNEGLGLGLFLAHATLERFDSIVSIRNRNGGGVCTEIVLPLHKLLLESDGSHN